MINNDDTKKALEAIERFLGVIKKLREPEGCPWDKEQTPMSMRRDLIEETFEAVDAITNEDPLHAKEELGDVFLNTMMISYMFEQQGDFTIDQSINALTDKLIRRHPHVFPESEGRSELQSNLSSGEDVLNQWDKIKANVEGRKGSLLDQVPQGFPPLLRAYKIQKKVKKVGFDWDNIEDVVNKVKEELGEVQEAYQDLSKILNKLPKDVKDVPFEKDSDPKVNEAQLHVEEEIGDLLFAVTNYARHLGVDPETALNRTNNKFSRRFNYVEQEMAKKGIPMDKSHFKEQDELWNEAKTKGL